MIIKDYICLGGIYMKRIILAIMISCIFLQTLGAAAQPLNADIFTDVPKGDVFEPYIYKLKELNITQGRGDGTFGYNQNITRAEFVTFLVRILPLQPDISPNDSMFADIKGNDWFYPAVNTGLKQGILLKTEYSQGKFLPNQPITREEMAVMIIRAMQYDGIATEIVKLPSKFKDVQEYKGHIEMAKDFGIINGKSADIFAPKANALRQEAAAMLVRMNNVIHKKLETLNGFYAIKSSGQADKIKVFDTVSYGWSRIEYNQETGHMALTMQAPNGGILSISLRDLKRQLHKRIRIMLKSI